MNNLEIEADQDALMKALVEAILPKTDIPGGLDLGIDGFVWVMADDCLKKKSQDQFITGSRHFSEVYNKLNSSTFMDENSTDQSSGLEKIINSKDTDEKSQSVRHFVKVTKEFCIIGFTKSEYFMTEQMPYQLVPGGYGPCETIDPSKPINRNA